METGKVSHIRYMLLLLTSLSFLTFSMAMICPHPEDLYPCRCTARMPGPLVFCGGHSITMSQVQTAIEVMVKSSHSFSLKLKNINIGQLDVNIFNNTMVHDLHIEDCILEGFIDTASDQDDTPSPPYPRTIMMLDIHNSIHSASIINLTPFENVNHLSLSNNVIKNLEIDWPINIMGPMTVNFVNNSIESVDEDAFAPLNSLSVLDMSMNRLKSLGKNMRPSEAHSIIRLDASRNQIKSISKYYFQNMHSLKYVSLSYNQIQVLDEKTWRFPWSQLDYVNLEENPLSCGKEIKWIQGRQPEIVRGTCATPEDKKSKTLSEVIKGNNPTESYLQGNFIQNKEENLEQEGFYHYQIHYHVE